MSEWVKDAPAGTYANPVMSDQLKRTVDNARMEQSTPRFHGIPADKITMDLLDTYRGHLGARKHAGICVPHDLVWIEVSDLGRYLSLMHDFGVNVAVEESVGGFWVRIEDGGREMIFNDTGKFTELLRP